MTERVTVLPLYIASCILLVVILVLLKSNNDAWAAILSVAVGLVMINAYAIERHNKNVID